MKYSSTFKMLGMVLNGIVKKAVKNPKVMKDIKVEYKAIVERASDIGDKNMLIGAYGLAAYFIAMNRCDGLDAPSNCDILEKGLKTSKMYKMTMGSGDSYFDEKRMVARRKWSEETYQHKYKNDWVVDILEKTDDYDFGMDYHECGVCKLCHDEGCPELAQYLCRLDFMTAEMMGIRLERTQTLAEGNEKCDFRYSKK